MMTTLNAGILVVFTMVFCRPDVEAGAKQSVPTKQQTAASSTFLNVNQISWNRNHSCKKSSRLLVTCASSCPNITVNSTLSSFSGVQYQSSLETKKRSCRSRGLARGSTSLIDVFRRL